MPSVIVYARRTAIGKMSGCFAQTPATKLGASLVKNALESLSLKPGEVDEIIMGQVLTAGVGQAPARQAAIYGGLAPSVCATTINRVCGSGLKAIMLANQAIRLGEGNTIFAGGQENMTLAPHLLMNSRQGYRFGNIEAKDHMQWDGLWDPYDNIAMGNCGEACAQKFDFSRQAQDEFSLRSYERAREANDKGYFKDEILPFEIQDKKQTLKIEKDEEPFSVDLAKLPTLRPAFTKDGTITAGNASSINDGAALLVVMEESTAKQKGLKPLARIVSQASYAHEPAWFTTAPIHGIQRLLKNANLSIKDIDLFEINEAFAVVTMAAMKELNIPADKVNIHGGTVAIGHPIGASGARIMVTLLHALKRKGLKRGVASICIGGGESSNVLVELIQ